MKKAIGFKEGYYIKIVDGFYEVIDGNRVVFFGECRKNSTIQEIANKTILSNGHGYGSQRVKRNFREDREKKYREGNQVNPEQNVLACGNRIIRKR